MSGLTITLSIAYMAAVALVIVAWRLRNDARKCRKQRLCRDAIHEE